MVILFWHVLSLVYSVVPLAKKTKLCGDEACTEKLFDGKFHRSMKANDERFLAPNVDDLVNIYAIKFSDRTDLMEGALLREPERRGSFFSSHITLDGYVNFLKSAVESNKTLFMISTDPHDHPAKKLVGLKSAYPELVKDYEVNSKRLVNEGVIPQAVPLNLAALDPKVVEALSDGHSHSGHGHSHGGTGYEHVHSHNPPPVATQPPPTKQLLPGDESLKAPVAEMNSGHASASWPSQQSPPTEQRSSPTHQQSAPTQQQPPPIQKQPPPAQQQPPPAQQQSSPVQQQPPPVQQQRPPVQEQPPPVQKQPPPAQQQPPPAQQQPPPVQQQPPPAQQQPSPVQQQPSPAQQQPPPAQQQPSPVQPQSPPTKQQPSPDLQQSSPTQQQSSSTPEQPSSSSQQSPSAETAAGEGGPPVAAANSATVSTNEHVNEHGFAQQNVLLDEESELDRFMREDMEKAVAAGVDMTPQGSNDSMRQAATGSTQQSLPMGAEAMGDSVNSQPNLSASQLRQQQNVLILNAGDGIEQHSPQPQIVRTVAVPVSGVPVNTQQPASSITSQQAVVRPASVPVSEIPIADPSVVMHKSPSPSAFVEQKNTGAFNTRKVQNEGLPDSSQSPVGVGAGVPVGSGVNVNVATTNPTVDGANTVSVHSSDPPSIFNVVDMQNRDFVADSQSPVEIGVEDEGLPDSSQSPVGVGAGVPVGSGVNVNVATANPTVDGANIVSVHSSDPPSILNVVDMQNRDFVADSQSPVEIGVEVPVGSSMTMNVADSNTIPDNTNTVPVASSSPSPSSNANNLQNGGSTADKQLPSEGGAQIPIGSGMTVDAAAINPSVSKTTIISTAPTINPPIHASGGLSEPQTMPAGDQFRADNVISRDGGGNTHLGSEFAEALPAQLSGSNQGQMFAGNSPLGSSQFPINAGSNEDTRIRQSSAQQSVNTQPPQPASDRDFSTHITNAPSEQFPAIQSPVVPSVSSIPANDVHAGTVPVESPSAKFMPTNTNLNEQEPGVILDTQAPLNIPVKSADGGGLNEALIQAQVPPTLQAHSLLAARASGGIPHEPVTSHVEVPTTTELPSTLPIDAASAHGSAPFTAVTPPTPINVVEIPLPPTATEQFPSTISPSDGISDGLNDRMSQPINSPVPSPPSEGQMRSDIFQNPSSATANPNAEGLDSLIKNEESANDTMQHLMDHIRMPISNETNASEVANNLTAQLNESVRIAFFVFNVSLFNNVDSFVRKTKKTKPEWESGDNVRAISGEQMMNSGSGGEVTNTTSRDENVLQMATKTDVKVSESETTVGLQDSIKETTRRSTNDLRTEIIEEDGLGYCIKGDCDKVYTEQPAPEQPQSVATPETSQSQSTAQSVPPLPSGQQRPTETLHEQLQPDHLPEAQIFQQSIDQHQLKPVEPSQVAANHQGAGQQQPAAAADSATFGNQPSQANAIDAQKEALVGAQQPVREESSGVGKWLSKVISLFRYALPPPLAGIDDAGVVVTLMVPICLVIHVLRTLFLSDNSEQDAFDRRALHDALTAVRERDEQIKVFEGVVVTLMVPICLVIHVLRTLFLFDNSEQDAFDRRALHDALTAIRERDEQIKILHMEAEKVHGMANRGKDEKIEQLELDLIVILHMEAEKVHGMANRGKDEKIEQLELDLGQGKLEIQQLRNKCGHLEETNERLRKEADEARKLAESERCKVNALCDEKKQLERSTQMLSDQIAEMQSTMENAREKNEKLEDELADKNALIARLETEARSRAVEVKKLSAQLQTSMEEGAMLRERVDALQNETVQLSEMIDELSKAKEVNTAVDSTAHVDDHGAHESGGQWFYRCTSMEEGAMLRERVDALQNETVQLSEMIDELSKAKEVNTAVDSTAHVDDHGAHESGGSAGWSDIGDFDIETSPSEEKKQSSTGNQSRKEKEGSPSKTNPADIMEVARLRAQLKRLEADLDQAKLALQKEENLREHLTRKVELAELEASERKKEAEAKEAERVDTHNQCKKMLIMVEERDARIRHSEEVTERLRDEVSKWQTEVRHLEEQNRLIQNKLNDARIRHSEEVTERLRDEVSKWQTEVRHLEEQNRLIQNKLNEAEQELKRLRAENNRLETRHFHEMRECKQTINALQQSLEAAQLAAISKPPDGGNLLNLSSNGSSDREFGAPFVSHLGPPPLPMIRPLWGDDEPAEVFSAGESSVMSGGLRGTTSPDDLSGVGMKKGTRSRRSYREPRDTSPDLGGQYTSRPKKESRRRSRSHGRHPYSSGGSYMPQVGGMPPAFPDLFNGPPLSKRNSKSGNLYYSSGGSNGGLSPPPEMALLSGVPPPGMTIKKPTATSRPKSVTEQMARHQN
uniref:Vegetative cell wall protein gp1 n=1 Tax=Ascaris lumbricoides TaxID=6252 RepID=A0A0M3I016_ASCLU